MLTNAMRSFKRFRLGSAHSSVYRNSRLVAGKFSFLLPIPSREGVKFFSTTPETLSFQAETKKLLDIVTNAIYTDKEVFLREIISNASDALEKFRYNQVNGIAKELEGSQKLHINIITDDVSNTLTIVDNGIGMSKDELIQNLGTIAKSGSKAFVEQLKGGSPENSSRTDGIIGQFGVGFYSSFMVSEHVSVESISALQKEDHGYRWSSSGTGEFQIEKLEQITGLHSAHGSKIVMKLKDSAKEFSNPERIKSVIKHYSNFVSFPIKVNGEDVNTVAAIWTKDKKEISDDAYNEFYKFIANAYDTPKFRLHFRTDAPIDLKVLLFTPSFHTEKFGMGLMEPGVNLYSRKVLIESKPKDLLPDWLRFLRGVVDSEDLPLSISREKPQDSNLLRRIRDVITRKFLKSLEDELKNNRSNYREFFEEYQMFLKQGLCQDHNFLDQISKLLLFDTSSTDDEMITLDEYISRCPPDQKNIYYLLAPNRKAALASPYFETFKKNKRDVLLVFHPIDDFVMTNLKTFGGRSILSIETSKVDADESLASGDSDQLENEQIGLDQLSDNEATEFCNWLSHTLGSKVREVKVTKRLSDSPAIVTDHENAALRKMLRQLEQSTARSNGAREMPPQVLEINPKHPLVLALHKLKDNPSSKAESVAHQLFDNALVAAGLLDDPRSMLSRLNDIMIASLK